MVMFLFANVGLIDFLAIAVPSFFTLLLYRSSSIEGKIGAPSASRPPPSAPQWVVDPQWKGVLHMHYCVH